MGEHRTPLAVTHQDETAGDPDDGPHRPHHLAIDDRPGKDLDSVPVDPRGEQQAVTARDEDPPAGLVEIDVTAQLAMKRC